jgi:hypothetical protein
VSRGQVAVVLDHVLCAPPFFVERHLRRLAPRHLAARPATAADRARLARFDGGRSTELPGLAHSGELVFRLVLEEQRHVEHHRLHSGRARLGEGGPQSSRERGDESSSRGLSSVAESANTMRPSAARSISPRLSRTAGPKRSATRRRKAGSA